MVVYADFMKKDYSDCAILDNLGGDMDAISLFSAGLRILGLLSAGRGIVDLLYSVMASLALTTRSVTDTFPFVDVVYGLFYLLMGLYLIRGAPWIVDFAFPVYTRSALDPDEDEDDAGSPT